MKRFAEWLRRSKVNIKLVFVVTTVVLVLMSAIRSCDNSLVSAMIELEEDRLMYEKLAGVRQ